MPKEINEGKREHIVLSQLVLQTGIMRYCNHELLPIQPARGISDIINILTENSVDQALAGYVVAKLNISLYEALGKVLGTVGNSLQYSFHRVFNGSVWLLIHKPRDESKGLRYGKIVGQISLRINSNYIITGLNDAEKEARNYIVRFLEDVNVLSNQSRQETLFKS